eukprot:scaffold13320_cov118-Isochrysis_galbana.AAC.8
MTAGWVGNRVSGPREASCRRAAGQGLVASPRADVDQRRLRGEIPRARPAFGAQATLRPTGVAAQTARTVRPVRAWADPRAARGPTLRGGGVVVGGEAPVQIGQGLDPAVQTFQQQSVHRVCRLHLHKRDVEEAPLVVHVVVFATGLGHRDQAGAALPERPAACRRAQQLDAWGAHAPLPRARPYLPRLELETATRGHRALVLHQRRLVLAVSQAAEVAPGEAELAGRQVAHDTLEFDAAPRVPPAVVTRAEESHPRTAAARVALRHGDGGLGEGGTAPSRFRPPKCAHVRCDEGRYHHALNPKHACGQVKRSRQSVADTWRPERSVRRYVVKSVTSSSASRSADGAGTDSLSTRQPVLHTQPGGLPRGSASRASPAAPSRSQLGGGATVQRPPASASCACVAGCSGSKSSGKLPCSARAASTNGPSGSSGQKESCISCRSAGRRERMASARQALSRAFSSSDRRRCSAWMSSR